MKRNPFKPGTGVSPPELIGRQHVVAAVTEALEFAPGHPGQITIFTGQRGVGKTVMLNESAHAALRLGWRVVDLTATPGILSRLDMALTRLNNVDNPPPRRRLTGVQVSGIGGLSLQPVAETAQDVRANLTELLEAGTSSGLLLTLDEVHRGVGEELRELGALAQHMVREERAFAVAMAGLPAAVSDLLSDQVLTFLRRAERHTLRALDVFEVAEALEHTFDDNGCRLPPDMSIEAATASRGYPYLVQLIGYHVWRHASGDTVDAEALAAGVTEATARLQTLVIEPSLQGLSDVDREFLVAMSADAERSHVGDIAERLSRDGNYVNFYRRRLIDAQLVEEAGRGYLQFALPYLGEYLRDVS